MEGVSLIVLSIKKEISRTLVLGGVLVTFSPRKKSLVPQHEIFLLFRDKARPPAAQNPLLLVIFKRACYNAPKKKRKEIRPWPI